MWGDVEFRGIDKRLPVSTESEPHSITGGSQQTPQCGLATAADSLLLLLASRKQHSLLSTISVLGIAVDLEERERVVTAPLHVPLVHASSHFSTAQP